MPSSFFPFSFGPPDEEMRRKMQEEHEAHLRSAIDFQHTLEEAWEKLGFEELYAVAQWLTMLCDSPADVIRSRLAYQSGSLFRLASQRGDKCMVCDKNHDEQVELLRAEAEAVGASEPVSGTIDLSSAPEPDLFGPVDVRQVHAPAGTPSECICTWLVFKDGRHGDRPQMQFTANCPAPGHGNTPEADTEAEASFQETQRIIAEHEAKVKEYRLQQDFKNGGFSCTGCGMHYRTLEDRMLKEPDIEGCPGCIHKAKFG